MESAVNHVGVDVNTASPSLLSYVAGINATIAQEYCEIPRGERQVHDAQAAAEGAAARRQVV